MTLPHQERAGPPTRRKGLYPKEDMKPGLRERAGSAEVMQDWVLRELDATARGARLTTEEFAPKEPSPWSVFDILAKPQETVPTCRYIGSWKLGESDDPHTE